MTDGMAQIERARNARVAASRGIVTCTQCGRDIAEYEAGVEK